MAKTNKSPLQNDIRRGQERLKERNYWSATMIKIL